MWKLGGSWSGGARTRGTSERAEARGRREQTDRSEVKSNGFFLTLCQYLYHWSNLGRKTKPTDTATSAEKVVGTILQVPQVPQFTAITANKLIYRNLPQLQQLQHLPHPTNYFQRLDIHKNLGGFPRVCTLPSSVAFRARHFKIAFLATIA